MKAGHEVLASGGEAIDAVAAAVSFMEDCPLFNAAHGAVFNLVGKVRLPPPLEHRLRALMPEQQELDTSIMLSKPPSPSLSKVSIPPERRGISITVMTRVRNPVKLARALYLAPYAVAHTMMAGSYTEDLGEKEGIELVDPSYFYTEQRWREHRRGLGLPEEPLPDGRKPDPKYEDAMDLSPKGTIGAVALDARGCIACATSTGGMNNKLPGRIGDTPVMGAGFWAEEFPVKSLLGKLFKKKKAVGISCTGDGDVSLHFHTRKPRVTDGDDGPVLHPPLCLLHRSPAHVLPRRAPLQSHALGDRGPAHAGRDGRDDCAR